MGSAVPTEGALVIRPPSLCRLGHMELLINPSQLLLKELHLLAQMLETCNAELCSTLAFQTELRFCLRIVTVPMIPGQIQECC